ncbi:MAG: rhodanese-like domain-containing protein [Thermoguttaceae bacterium]|nr:rhodanese-like domain-containing protein [Thermoguttaceae bacterium]
MGYRTMTAEAFRAVRVQKPGGVILDVRTPIEYREVHVQDAQSIPLDTLTGERIRQLIAEYSITLESPVYILCRSGGRATQAAERFDAAGFGELAVRVDGGTTACIEAGVPVIRTAGVISLERQVRIVAGLLVLLGAVLGVLVHPYWCFLSMFVGFGLTFSGITNWCGMALLLAKMPWNRSSGNSCSACQTTANTCKTSGK